MRVYTVPCGESTLDLGRAGENQAQRLDFNISNWVRLFGAGNVSLLVRRPSDAQPYPVVVTADLENGTASWVVSDLDTAKAGFGQAELMYLVDNAVVKSRVWQTYVAKSLDGSNPGDPTEDPWAAYIASVTKAATDAEAAAQRAQEALEHQPKVQDGTLWVWDTATGEYKDTGAPADGLTEKQAAQLFLALSGGTVTGPIKVDTGSASKASLSNISLSMSNSQDGATSQVRAALIQTKKGSILCKLTPAAVTAEDQTGYCSMSPRAITCRNLRTGNLEKVSVSGGISDLPVPTADYDAVPRKYVDDGLGSRLTQEDADKRYVALDEENTVPDTFAISILPNPDDPNEITLVDYAGILSASYENSGEPISASLFFGTFQMSAGSGMSARGLSIFYDGKNKDYCFAVSKKSRLNFSGTTICGIETPTDDSAPTPKSYVDGLIGDIGTILDNINGEVV